MNNLICDKCGSENINQYIIEPVIEKPKPVKMTDFSGFSTCVSAVYRPAHWKLECKDCGFTHELIQ